MSFKKWQLAILAIFDVIKGQENINLEDRIFLTSSHPEAGLINYIELYEDQESGGALKQFRDWRPLITGLKWPTYTAYDYLNQYFYVCDCDELHQYKVDFVNTNGVDIIYTTETANDSLIGKRRCGGMTLDKLNNLFFVDVDASEISLIKRADLLNQEDRSDYSLEMTLKYDALRSKTV